MKRQIIVDVLFEPVFGDTRSTYFYTSIDRNMIWFVMFLVIFKLTLVHFLYYIFPGNFPHSS